LRDSGKALGFARRESRESLKLQDLVESSLRSTPGRLRHRKRFDKRCFGAASKHDAKARPVGRRVLVFSCFWPFPQRNGPLVFDFHCHPGNPSWIIARFAL
jgi:hypothetical protein